ncbi:MAG: MBL fold metallo-hydrolase [Nanoarchaeota archaeon]|nr:MBL fold metallo-hydrolase [Nanoarchaeota archaeon]
MKFENINLNWLGHSGFLIQTLDGIKIYIDPYKINTTEKADIILLTHPHYDHCSLEDLQKISKNKTIVLCPADCQSKLTKLNQEIDVRITEPEQEWEIGEIKIKAVPAYNINKAFHDKSELWNGYIIEINKTRIYHAGDTDLIPEIKNLKEIDLALIPVGGIYTMNHEQASNAAKIINPKLVVPMHYGSVIGTEKDADDFIEMCKKQGINAEKIEKS